MALYLCLYPEQAMADFEHRKIYFASTSIRLSEHKCILCSIHVFACLLLSILTCNNNCFHSVLLNVLSQTDSWCAGRALCSLAPSLRLSQPLHSVRAQVCSPRSLRLATLRYKCVKKATNQRTGIKSTL